MATSFFIWGGSNIFVIERRLDNRQIAIMAQFIKSSGRLAKFVWQSRFAREL